ncbi:hypothetical protein V1478_010995, partial [Vespula squamosa]
SSRIKKTFRKGHFKFMKNGRKSPEGRPIEYAETAIIKDGDRDEREERIDPVACTLPRTTRTRTHPRGFAIVIGHLEQPSMRKDKKQRCGCRLQRKVAESLGDE